MSLSALELTATELEIVERTDPENLRKLIVAEINEMIEKDFQRLVSILYRLDVSEEKIRTALVDPAGENAGEVITALILERQAQKIESRKNFKPPEIDETEERW